MTSPTLWGFSIFCEVIREEIGGTSSWIGVLKGSLDVISDFPVMIANLSVIIKYYEVPGLHNEDLEFRIYGTDDVVVAGVKFEKNFRESFAKLEDEFSGEGQLISLEIPFEFSPMNFSKPGVLKVRMFDGAQEVKLGSLMFKSGPAPA
jgi:hypothetical protein